jgi:hypothetical protein
MPKQTHTHKLRRHKYPSGNSVFFCTLPDCHYKIDVPLALGKRSICNICGEEFIINEYTIKLAKPHCLDCGKVKVKGSDGKNRYVKKVTNKVLAGVATDSLQDLRSRLDNISSASLEDDI